MHSEEVTLENQPAPWGPFALHGSLTYDPSKQIPKQSLAHLFGDFKVHSLMVVADEILDFCISNQFFLVC